MTKIERPAGVTRLFQISEPRLAELERLVPETAEAALSPDSGSYRLLRLRRIGEIVSDIRWGYVPGMPKPTRGKRPK